MSEPLTDGELEEIRDRLDRLIQFGGHCDTKMMREMRSALDTIAAEKAEVGRLKLGREVVTQSDEKSYDAFEVLRTGGWVCFHCGERFTNIGSAKDHFGPSPKAESGCELKVRVGGERGLLMELRKVEQQLSLATRTERGRCAKIVQTRAVSLQRDAEQWAADNRAPELPIVSRELNAAARELREIAQAIEGCDE